MDGSKLPKGWRKIDDHTIMSERFGEYYIWINTEEESEQENVFVITILNEDHKAIIPAKRYKLTPDWHIPAKTAQTLAYDLLDDMHTKITQAMDRFDELFDEWLFDE